MKDETRTAIKGTLVGNIIACLNAGNFRDTAAGTALKDRDIFLGEMSSYERACATVADDFKRRHDELDNDIIAMGVPANEELSKKLCLFLNNYCWATDEMMSSIISRVDLKNASGITFREGFKIVGVLEADMPKHKKVSVTILGVGSSQQADISLLAGHAGYPH